MTEKVDDAHPFTIDVPESDIEDLQDRLDRTRWPDELPDTGWEYGVPLGYLRELVDYWRVDYDWRDHEARLNEFPQFTTEIDGQTIHFLHARSSEPDATGLLLAHGWPGSVVEFLDVIESLTDPETHGGEAADAFDVIVPSIPGFGFSGPTGETGWSTERTARVLATLMARVGYDRYVAHGTDVGAILARELGMIDGEHVAGVHVAQLFSFPSGDPDELDVFTAEDYERLEALERYDQQLSGYATLQAQRPHTLAFALTDSPVGQLAWIVERFKDWTDSEDRPEDAVNRDRLLTNVMVYWLTRTAASSARTYKDSGGSWESEPTVSDAPTGVAVFPHDINPTIRPLAERDNTNIVHWSEFDHGGHFAAMEAPDILAEDLRTFNQLLA